MWSLQKTELWDPVFFHHVGLGLSASISYETSFQSCCKMCRLGFVNGLYMMALHYIFSSNSCLLEQDFSGTMEKTKCTNCTASSFHWFKSVIFLFLWTFWVCCIFYKFSVFRYLQQRTQIGFEMTGTKLGIFQWVMQLLFRRVTSSFEAQGG